MPNPEQRDFPDLRERLDQFDTLIDVRSPSEYADDHLPGAISCPVLDDEQRARVGTLYKQVSTFEARKLGAALVARNIAAHLEARFSAMPQSWKPLVYCWRGGQRSGAMAHILARVGWQVVQLHGGYKGYRRVVLDDLVTLPATLSFRVLTGPTGSGKSRLLDALRACGAQVLDLEGLARHRGSLLGDLPDQPQPSQRGFESALWNALRGCAPQRPVYVEAESKRIGALRVPEELIGALHASPCLRIELPFDERVRLLTEDYTHLMRDPDTLVRQLEALVPLHGHAAVTRWTDSARAGDWPTLVAALLEAHYDPAYRRSTGSHFALLDAARVIELQDGSEQALRGAAMACVEATA